MSIRPIRIALINDYEIVLAGIREMLAPHADRLEVVEMGANRDVLSEVDIALYDTYGQDEAALQALSQPLAAAHVGKVVIYTWQHTPALLAAARQAGVHGVLSKALDADDLAEQLLRIARGERPDAQDLGPAAEQIPGPDEDQRWAALDAGVLDDSTTPAEPVLQPLGARWPGRDEGLTMREAEMITLISQGLSNAEIAGRTYLSPNSVKSYIRAAYRKIGVQRRSQAVAWGIDHAMVPDRSRQLL